MPAGIDARQHPRNKANLTLLPQGCARHRGCEEEEQLARQMLRGGLRGATAGERVQQRLTTDVLERTVATQNAAEPMGLEVMMRGCATGHVRA